MAIINSIVMGKSKGKIGNVVTTTLKGQVIAKARNYNPANPKTAGQVASRGKMSNAVKAWQFLAIFLVFTKPFAKKTESTYNAFISFAKNLFNETVLEFGYLAAAYLAGQDLFITQIATVISTNTAGPGMSTLIEKNGIAWSASLRLRMLVFDKASGYNILIDQLVSESDYLAGAITSIVAVSTTDVACVYLYDSILSKCSNVLIADF